MTFISIYCGVIAVLFGACMGSFLNCMGWRIVHGESVMKGRSHCDECGHVLGFFDLIPILSYLIFNGKCRYCGKKLSKSHLLAEGASAAVFLVTYLRFGLTVQTVEYILFASVLLACSVTDLYDYIIPDRFLIIGSGIWLIFLLFSGDIVRGLISGLIGGVCIGGGLLLVVLVFEKVRKKEAMGGGDIKLLAMTGLYLGWQKNFLCLFAACILGIVFAVVGMRKQDGDNEEENKLIPWGPSIAAAAWLTALFGDAVLQLYLGLF